MDAGLLLFLQKSHLLFLRMHVTIYKKQAYSLFLIASWHLQVLCALPYC